MQVLATRTFMYDNKMYFEGDVLDVDQDMATRLGSLVAVETGESEVAKATEDSPPATSPTNPAQRETKPAKTKIETK